MTLTKPRWRDPRLGLLLILLAAFAQGVLRASVVPDWFNFDEPGHMEYVLYVTENRRIPASHDIDFELRQRISNAVSEVDCSNDIPGEIAGCLGFHQLQEQPLYYLIQAVFQWVFNPATLTGQLRLARIVSVLMHLGVVITAWYTMQLIFPDKPLTWVAVSGGAAILPGMSSMMSTVNNDVLAALAGALLIYATVALTVRGFSIVRLIMFALACVLTLFSKTTAVLLVPAALLGGWFTLRFKRGWLYAAPLGLLVLLPFVLSTGNSAAWLNQARVPHNRIQDESAPDGSYVFYLPPEARLIQYLSQEDIAALRGETVSVSARVRGSDGAIMLDDSSTLHIVSFSAGEEWSVVEAEIPVAPDALYLSVALQSTGETRFDDVRLPGTDGTNLLRNASAERSWLLLHPAIDARMPYGLNQRLQGLYSWRLFGRYYLESVSAIFLSFWGSFGWGATMFQMPFTGVLGLLTAAGIPGLLLLLWRNRHSLTTTSARAMLVLFIFTAVSLFFTYIRTDMPAPDPASGQFIGFIPSARYFYPALTAALGLLLLSWSALVPHSAQRWLLALFLGGLYSAHMLSLFTVQMSALIP